MIATTFPSPVGQREPAYRGQVARWVLIRSTLLFTIRSPCMANSLAPPPVRSADFIQRILVDRVDDRRLSRGLSVGITEAGEHLVVTRGRRDETSGNEVSDKTVFEIGSLTKLFTVLVL